MSVTPKSTSLGNYNFPEFKCQWLKETSFDVIKERFMQSGEDVSREAVISQTPLPSCSKEKEEKIQERVHSGCQLNLCILVTLIPVPKEFYQWILISINKDNST